MRGFLIHALVLLVSSTASTAFAEEEEVAAGVYVRTDTDQTQVISPYADARVRLGDRTIVNAGYAADIWTSASIDIRTAATRRVSEQRDQVSGGIEHELDDVSLSANYRYSHENDYVSHGGSLQATWRFAQNNATLRGRVSAAFDSVGRSGDDGFDRSVSTLGALAVFTQNLDAKSLVQGAYEVSRREGYQASPYRFVGIGGDGALCGQGAQFCVPELHPNLRVRHSIVGRARRAFGPLSVGLGYRFYYDSWELMSHTVILDTKLVPGEHTILNFRYRFYRQGDTDFYESSYDSPDALPRFLTRDREMGALYSHRVALSIEQSFDITQSGPELKATLGTSASRFTYDDFIGLNGVWAFDVTFSLAVVL